MNNEIINLADEIYRHDLAYWKYNKPVISDEEYDKLISKLQKLDPDNKYFQEVKTPQVSSLGKVTHKVKMLSLDKAYSFDEILKWCKKVSRGPLELFRIMPKYDGVSGQLIDGVLATRGDGEVGEDITHKLPFMNIIKKHNNDNVRGEILFRKSTFQKIKNTFTRKSGEPYKNERNAVGGVLTRDDLKPRKILTFIDFDHTVTTVSLEQMEKGGQKEWDTYVEFIKATDYPVDGIVVQLSDRGYGYSLGTTRHHAKDSIAFKFANPFAYSKIINIIWSPGKYVLTPIAIIEPVEINGVTIKRVSLANLKNILDNDIYIGDIVKVERAGDVIPYITEVKPGENRLDSRITNCPVCNHLTVYKDPELTCSNINCPGKHLNTLMDSVIRIGIDRLGKPTLEKMVEVLGVTNLVDIFNLTKDDILNLPGFADTSADNLLNEINKVKTEGVFEWQLLSCLNIEGIGRSLSKDLLKNKDLFTLSCYAVDDWVKHDGIGLERANALIKGLIDNSVYLNKLTKILPIKTNVESPNGLIKICFTGKFPEKKSSYYEQLNKIGGYEIMEKVNKDLDILVVADPSKESNKTKSAKKNRIKIMGINELMGGNNV